MHAYQSPAELADELGVHAKTVKRWINRGELAAHNLGSAVHPIWRISSKAKAAFLNVRRSSGEPERVAATAEP